MPTHVALLRGINVGGRNRVAMADLREVVSSLGHTEVTTYIQSGNVVFTSQETDTAALGAALERAIADALGVRPRVVVLSRAELSRAVEANPYPDEANPKYVHAVFLGPTEAAPDAAAIAAAQERARGKGGRDEAAVVGRTIYLHTPDGLGRSLLAEELSRGKTTSAATMRNWATVTKLLAMLNA